MNFFSSDREQPNHPEDKLPSYALPGSVDIYTTEALREELQSYLHTAPAAILDLSEVTAWDMAGIQLLCAVKRSADVEGKPFQLLGMHPGLREVLTGFGIETSHLALEGN